MMTNSEFERYTSSEVSNLYSISLETVRVWCSEFEEYLSPRANPGHRQKRVFSEEDMEVLALVAMLRNEGFQFSDIHVALKNGQRGIVPKLEEKDASEDSNALAVNNEAGRALVQQVKKLEVQIEVMREENDRLKQELDAARQNSIRNEVKSEMLQEQLTKLDDRVRELLKERSDLERSIGEMTSDLKWHKNKDE